ncbi:TPA: DUF4148 domain-containing protein [Burkholderia vietnamiensis]|uniref:DUF4148 domain-containing protein n=1 Tax=Burkholderia vietnamiensis TaxID=60552 RepID=A0AA44Y1M0_BURVI|nr:DUF4148 domain-containing protein [Burkholderia vietnamiensis]KVS21687.1 hypothetical protein WK32_18170 [Burkholderia vietnamiensis]MCA8210897.1 DUF4148 domain-containing protein [Burkholderia vietnamiensis]PRH42155.1 DUF4148 domain-containing protein [Burkholderia vietnamiensis]HDR9100712.1 DUF4148 domain-containing protein [Burkholderia vietnamiensis]HDR9121165.1 DUF4148 domain-containing protein [Burkholderia vietnamiensis]
MKLIIYAAIAASVLAAPIASFAQSEQGLTRAQVRAELVQLEQNGYKPLASDAQYPQNIEAAEQRIQPNQPVLAQADTSGYGAVATGAGQSGRRSTHEAPNPVNSVYFGN